MHRSAACAAALDSVRAETDRRDGPRGNACADAEALYRKLDDAGVDVTLLMYHGTFHAFAPIGTSSPETTELLIDNIHFMKRCWGEE